MFFPSSGLHACITDLCLSLHLSEHVTLTMVAEGRLHVLHVRFNVECNCGFLITHIHRIREEESTATFSCDLAQNAN